MAPIDNQTARVSRLVALVTTLHDHYARYHDHKESMAYAGFTLYLGIVGAALFSDKWPPKPHSYWPVVEVLLLWAGVLVYLKFQLIRRRWAALRQAGCERLLARWATKDPTATDTQLWTTESRLPTSLWLKVTDWVVPRRAAVTAVKTDQTVYPRVLVEEWKDRQVEGTTAILHERLIVISGWILFFALLYRTCRGA